MNFPLFYKYYTLLFVSIISCCLLFFLVASESSKYSSESIVEPFDPKSVGTVNNLDDLQRTIEQIFNEEEINQAYSTTVTPDTDLPFTIFEPTTTSTPDVSINLVLSDFKDKDEKRTFLLPDVIHLPEIKRSEPGPVRAESGELTEEQPTEIFHFENKNQLEQTKLGQEPQHEEHPIPVFSEWAQQRMEEAEKKLEENQNSSQMKQNRNISGNKLPVIKLRAKNYASPDCGAKILASNHEAQSVGSVLTAHKDEYLLSPCTGKIWFVVELCEPIQCERVELANFELFSSSPKDLSVAVGNRFPTRDWSNVGVFQAKDERDIQNFDLSPRLFGKFVRVDISSHYNSEHYCPLSLFRVFGTSEFEAFETDNEPASLDDDEEDDEENEVRKDKNQNLLNRAGEAVMNIVKKAAEVLVKSNDQDLKNNNHNETVLTTNNFESNGCMSLSHNVLCQQCNEHQLSDLVDLMSCNYGTLEKILTESTVRESLYSSAICSHTLGFPLKESTCDEPVIELSKNSFIGNIISLRYINALCNLVATIEKRMVLNKKVDELPSIVKHKFETVLHQDDGKNLKNISNPNKFVVQESKNDMNLVQKKKEEPEVPAPQINEFTENVETVQSEHIKEDLSDDKGNVNIFNVVEDKTQSDDSSNPSNLENRDIPNIQIQETTISSEVDSDQVVNNTWGDMENIAAISEAISNGNDSNNNTAQYTQKVHPESVFLRLSNRIKALERNMSLSSQYLEELSKRYKRQVEELQNSFSKTIQALDENNLRNYEREERNSEESRRLREHLESLSEKINSFENLAIFIGITIFFQIVFLCIVLRIRSPTRMEEEYLLEDVISKKKLAKSRRRRRSLNDICGQLIEDLPARRTSNEDESNIELSFDDLHHNDMRSMDDNDLKTEKKKTKQRMRKHSAPILMQKQQKKYFVPLDVSDKKSRIKLIRTESAPSKFTNDIALSQMEGCIDENGPLLEDNDEFIIPNASDFAYNEFVPTDQDKMEVSSQISTDSVRTNSSSKMIQKTRRLSSPIFLKSALSRKSFKKDGKPKSEKTNWEWLKIVKGDSQIVGQQTERSKKAKSVSPQRSHPEVEQCEKLSATEVKKSNSFSRFLKKVF